jgi:hypothetical protein
MAERAKILCKLRKIAEFNEDLVFGWPFSEGNYRVNCIKKYGDGLSENSKCAMA